MSEEEDIWRRLVNNMEDADLSDKGAGPPKMEAIERKPVRDGETPVVLQKIITEMYVYTSLVDKDMWYGAQSFQDVQLLGNMRLSEALSVINARKKKGNRRTGR